MGQFNTYKAWSTSFSLLRPDSSTTGGAPRVSNETGGIAREESKKAGNTKEHNAQTRIIADHRK
eukprot:282808-Pelagomonas_calceolata.AAC.5